jgi:carbonic anhydrase/acetyltransferase-like protein (isoleucine patch superfamily)
METARAEGVTIGTGMYEMLIESEGSSPTIDPTAYIAPTATICGDVVIGPDTCVAFGAVLTAEGGSLRIGANCVIREQAVIRATEKHDTVIGDHVLIGPHAYLVGCTIGECAFLATGATVFHGASIGARAEVRINGTVHVQTRLPPNVEMPIGWIAVGDPARNLAARSSSRNMGSRWTAKFSYSGIWCRPAGWRRHGRNRHYTHCGK